MATETETLPRWIHCNVCCATKNNKPFVMNSCGHLTCSDCADRKGPQTCCKCGSKCSKVHLKHPLPPQVGPWLSDPLPSLKRLHNIFKFQSTHYNCYMDLQMKQCVANFKALLIKKQVLENKKRQLIHQISMIQKTLTNIYPQTTPQINLESSTMAASHRQITLQTPTTLGIGVNNDHWSR